jgi:TPR repeat protein
VRLHCLAAAQGHANAQFGFGNMLSAGDGLQDKTEAIRRHFIAAISSL